MYLPEEIKAVGADLDGTLLPASKIIPAGTRDVINRLMKRGIPFFPVTGKTLSLTKEIFRGLDVPMVALEGAHIHVMKEDIWNVECLIKSELCREIINRFPRFSGFVVSDDRIFVRGEVAKKHYVLWGGEDVGRIEECDFKHTTLIVFISDERGVFEEARETICHLYGEYVVPYLTPQRYLDKYYLTLRSVTTGKYRGVEKLLSYYNLTMKEMLFFGDWKNDIPMLKRVGFPVAMRNAEEDVAKYARAMTLKNEEEGVAHFLRGFFNL